MSDGESAAEAWESIRWVESIQDPSMHFDKLHESFEKIVFGLAVPEDDETASDASGNEEDEEEDMEDDLAEANRELLGEGEDEANEDEDEGSDAFENISEEEERERLQDDLDVSGWQDWLMGRHRQQGTTTAQEEATKASERTVEVELERVGLGQRDMIVKDDVLPERYKLIAVEEKRGMLGPKLVTANFGSSIDLHQEAVWVLHQLRRPGQPFARSEVAAEVAAKPYDHLLVDPLVTAIAYALEKMTKEFLEPSHLMMYHQSPLMPLLYALWHHSAELAHFNSDKVNPSFAYCTTTGRRQKPSVVSDAVTFELFASQHGAAYDSHSGTPQQRKPCLIELGRLLQSILDLDVLCHRLEHTRQVLLISLQNHLEPRKLLVERVFDHKTEADMWGAYATFLVDVDTSYGRTATHRIRQLGLSSEFEEYSITGAQYHENLCSGAAAYTCRLHNEDLFQWINEHARNLGRDMSGDQLLDLFNRSIAEQFSKLPTLRKRVFDAFCSDAECIVTTLSTKSVSSISVSTLLSENTQLYYDLLLQEKNGTIQLELALDELVIRNIMNVRLLYDPLTSSDPWYVSRSKAIDMTILQIIRSVRRDVRIALRSAAESAGVRIACSRLSGICSEGPYAQTRLAIEGVDPTKRTWEGSWNAFEALAAHPTRPQERARVCAAFRGENGVTCFACIDQGGNVCGFTRWTDMSVSSDAGSVAHLNNLHALKLLLQEHCPYVIAVAAQKQTSSSLFRTLEQFIEKQVQQDELVHIPIVWAAPAVALAYTHSISADTEMGVRDPVSRSTVSLARYVQDPLFEVCQLFDASHSVLLLPLGAHNAVSKRKLVRALSAEMTLWIAAVGIDLQEALRWPNPKSIVQFVAGFGPLKAAALVDILRLEPLVSRPQVEQLLTENFGEFVAANAVPTFRVSSEEADPLDASLLPLSWYPAVEALAMSAYSSPLKERSMSMMFLQDAAQLRHSFANVNVPLLVAQLRDCYPEYHRFGKAEVHLIMDEVLAGGKSFMRRPFRLMTTINVFRLLTGVVVATEKDTISAAEEFVTLRFGDVVQGTIAGPRLGRVEFGSADGLRVLTSQGVAAFISGAHISDQNTLKELAEYRIGVEENRRSPFPSTGKIVYGTIIGCNWERCELKLAWSNVPPPVGDGRGVQSAATVPRDNRSVNSVLTKDILEATAVNSMKISRHTLFKNITRQRAAELLRDKFIGELLIRGSSRKNYATICVKIGDRMIANWPVKETRNSAGQCRYIIDHRRVGGKHEFEEVDQCLEQFIRPTIDLVKELRRHRKFVSEASEIMLRLQEEAQSRGGFAYAFGEGNDDENPPTFYKVYYRINGRDKTLKLHFGSDALYLRLPDRDGKSEWFPCKNAEMVSVVLKKWIEMMMRGASN